MDNFAGIEYNQIVGKGDISTGDVDYDEYSYSATVYGIDKHKLPNEGFFKILYRPVYGLDPDTGMYRHGYAVTIDNKVRVINGTEDGIKTMIDYFKKHFSISDLSAEAYNNRELSKIDDEIADIEREYLEKLAALKNLKSEFMKKAAL